MKNSWIIILLLLVSNAFSQKANKFTDCVLIFNGGDSALWKINKKYVGDEFSKYDYKLYVTKPDFKREYEIDLKYVKEIILDKVSYIKMVLKTQGLLETTMDTVFIHKSTEYPLQLYTTRECRSSYNAITGSGFIGNADCLLYFYIKKPQDGFAFLVAKKPTLKLQICTQPRNDAEFLSYFSDYPELKDKLVNKIYKRQDIEQIVKEYNSKFKK